MVKDIFDLLEKLNMNKGKDSSYSPRNGPNAKIQTSEDVFVVKTSQKTQDKKVYEMRSKRRK